MDNVEVIPPEHGSGAIGEDIRVEPAVDLTVLRRLKVTSLEQMRDLLQDYVEFSAQHPTTTMPPAEFAQHLYARRDAWFVEVGSDGIAFFTDVVPNATADFHIAFWDRKFPRSRIELVRCVVRTAIERFDLFRVEAVIPAENTVLMNKLNAVGFALEGTIRRGWYGISNAILMGLLPEDLSTCQTPTMPLSGLD